MTTTTTNGPKKNNKRSPPTLSIMTLMRETSSLMWVMGSTWMAAVDGAVRPASSPRTTERATLRSSDLCAGRIVRRRCPRCRSAAASSTSKREKNGRPGVPLYRALLTTRRLARRRRRRRPPSHRRHPSRLAADVGRSDFHPLSLHTRHAPRTHTRGPAQIDDRGPRRRWPTSDCRPHRLLVLLLLLRVGYF